MRMRSLALALSLALSLSVKLPIHILGKLCPVLNISLVSNRQEEPQMSDTCLAHIHREAGFGRNSSCETQLIPMWVRKWGHLATALYRSHWNGGTSWDFAIGMAIMLVPGCGFSFFLVLIRRNNKQTTC